MLDIQTCPMSLISIWGLCLEAETDIDVVLELVLRLTTSQVDNFVDKIQMLAFQTCTWAGLEVNWLERLYGKRSSYKFEIVTWSSALKFDQLKKKHFLRFGFIRQNVSRVFPSILKKRGNLGQIWSDHIQVEINVENASSHYVLLSLISFARNWLMEDFQRTKIGKLR